MFTDTHCHLNRLNLERHGGDVAGVIAAMLNAKVSCAMAIMCDFAEYDEITALIQRFDGASTADFDGLSAQQVANVPSTVGFSTEDCSAENSSTEDLTIQLSLGMSVGVHPCESLATLNGATVDKLVALADVAHVWAIGETGLDYYWSEDNKQAQQQSLARHIHASQQLKKPLVVHTREAKHDTIDILRAERAEHGIIHCFTEDWDTAKRALDLGFYISFSGITTFKTASSLREVAVKVPKDRLLIETDSPYLAPVPMRGKPNEPAYVPYVAQCLAELLNVTAEELGNMTSKNFQNLLAQYH